MTSKKQIAEIILASFTAIFLAAFIRLFFFDTYIVTNKSMEPTFFEGDEILLLKKSFIFNRVKNFDVIVFNYEGSNLVKRVIGIEGDKVEIKDGGLYLNDELIEHEYYIFSDKDDGLYIVGSDQYFVLGDNIDVSEDSRYFGFIDKDSIKGQVILIFSPKSRFQLFSNIFHHNK